MTKNSMILRRRLKKRSIMKWKVQYEAFKAKILMIHKIQKNFKNHQGHLNNKIIIKHNQ